MEQPRTPWHAGERAVQARIGVMDRMEARGRLAIRPFMPDQHRLFFAGLPYLLVGSADGEGWPTASLLFGPPGFVTTPDETRMRIAAHPGAFDPLADNLRLGSGIGILGIDLTNRRRNRMNGTLLARTADGFELKVQQSFGNCDQYIQIRSFDAPGNQAVRTAGPVEALSRLDAAAVAFLGRADTFFVASCAPRSEASAGYDCDISHRGGRPGFVLAEGDSLTIPDFSGNFYFNTFGNFALNPKAGLLFPDFETGDLLFVWGEVEMLWDGERLKALKGAKRAWRVHVTRALRVAGAARPLVGTLRAYSPITLRTGTWTEADARLARETAWRRYCVTAVTQEAEDIKSFHLAPADGTAPPAFQPGQYLPVRPAGMGQARPARCYSLSSAPGADTLRLTVKRVRGGAGGPPGFLSNHLHDAIRPGDEIEALPPQGSFVVAPDTPRPVALVSAGVGITPMMAMARAALEGQEAGAHVTFIHVARTEAERPFTAELRDLERRHPERLSLHLLTTRADGEEEAPRPTSHGRPDASQLAALLPPPECEVFLCGPGAFMQEMYDGLRRHGVADARIHAEAFGPAALKRTPDGGPAELTEGEDIATDASAVVFVRSGIGKAWRAGDGTILSMAEDMGIDLPSACRSGICGACAQPLVSGEVTYLREPIGLAHAGEVLVCCAAPKPGEKVVILA